MNKPKFLLNWSFSLRSFSWIHHHHDSWQPSTCDKCTFRYRWKVQKPGFQYSIYSFSNLPCRTAVMLLCLGVIGFYRRKWSIICRITSAPSICIISSLTCNMYRMVLGSFRNTEIYGVNFHLPRSFFIFPCIWALMRPLLFPGDG